MFTPQTFLNVFILFQQLETIKTKKCNRLLSKNCIPLKSTVIQGAEAEWQDQIHNGPLSQLMSKTAMHRNTDPRHRVASLQTLIPAHWNAGIQASATATTMSSTVGELQNTGKFKAPTQKSSSSAEGHRLSCTWEQQEGVAQVPQCLDRVPSSHNNVLDEYWDVCFSSQKCNFSLLKYHILKQKTSFIALSTKDRCNVCTFLIHCLHIL